MSDDWRLQVDLHDGGSGRTLAEMLEATELEHDLESSFHDRVIVSRDDAEVFCYAGTREQAERAQALIERLAAEHGWHVDCTLRHWHPSAEDWEDPDKQLPHDDAQRAAEHAALIQQEREDYAQRGYPEWEVRVQCPTHHDASQLSQQLRDEGLPNLRRWKYLLIGATDEDMARQLAERIQAQAPAGTSTRVEGTARDALDQLPGRPFAIFGGLGV